MQKLSSPPTTRNLKVATFSRRGHRLSESPKEPDVCGCSFSCMCSARKLVSRGSARWNGQHAPSTLLSSRLSSMGVFVSVKVTERSCTQCSASRFRTGKQTQSAAKFSASFSHDSSGRWMLSASSRRNVELIRASCVWLGCLCSSIDVVSAWSDVHESAAAIVQDYEAVCDMLLN